MLRAYSVRRTCDDVTLTTYGDVTKIRMFTSNFCCITTSDRPVSSTTHQTTNWPGNRACGFFSSWPRCSLQLRKCQICTFINICVYQNNIEQRGKYRKENVGNFITRDDFSLVLLTTSVRRRVCRVVKQMSFL